MAKLGHKGVNMNHKVKDTGSCYCGKIIFELWDFDPQYSTCHCTECRKWTGSFYACIAAKTGDYKISGSEHITWYLKTPNSEQGFCKTCGSAIFWREKPDIGYLDFAIGMLDNPQQLTARRHIFCKNKADFYALPNDGASKYDTRD